MLDIVAYDEGLNILLANYHQTNGWLNLIKIIADNDLLKKLMFKFAPSTFQTMNGLASVSKIFGDI